MTCFLNIVFRWIIVPILAFLVSYSFCLIEIRWRIRIKRNARKDIDDTIRVRKELIRLRTAFGRVARILCLAATVIAIAYVGGNYNGLLSIMPVFIALAAFRIGFSWVWGKVSTKKAQDILAQTEPFILYLRAFESDVMPGGFSEQHFVKTLGDNDDRKMYAVGLPEEVDAPAGAERVYLDDKTWKNDVAELMSKADCIYLRICDTESCLWEMAQARTMIGKVKFIVDRFDDYARVRPMLLDDMPELEVIEKGFYLLEPDDEKDWVIHRYLPLNLRYVDVSGEGKETEYSGVIKKEGKKHGLIAAICFSVFAGVMVYEFRSPNYSLYFTSRSDPFGQEVERFRAKNDSLADVYGQAKWEKVVELTKEQYRGDLSKDDSLDRVFPKTYYVQKIKGKIQPREIKVVPSNTDSLLSNMNRDRYRDAGWGMSIDEVSNIPYFRTWSRSFSPYHSSSRDSDYTVSFLNGVDTLAGVPFDYVLSFVEKPAMGLGGILLRSREYDDDSLLRRDLGSVCHQLRRKYGLPFDSAIYQHRWELTWKEIRCDTVAMGSGWAIRVMEIPELPDQGLFYSILRRHYSQRE